MRRRCAKGGIAAPNKFSFRADEGRRTGGEGERVNVPGAAKRHGRGVRPFAPRGASVLIRVERGRVVHTQCAGVARKAGWPLRRSFLFALILVNRGRVNVLGCGEAARKERKQKDCCKAIRRRSLWQNASNHFGVMFAS